MTLMLLDGGDGTDTLTIQIAAGDDGTTYSSIIKYGEFSSY